MLSSFPRNSVESGKAFSRETSSLSEAFLPGTIVTALLGSSKGLAAKAKPQLAAAVGFVKAVASEAVLREDRTDLAVEVDGGFRRVGG